MKKLIALLLTLCLLGGMLTACARKAKHGHIYPPEWVTDETYHWHVCKNPTCFEPADKAEHTFGEAEIIKPAAKGESGVQSRTCTVCGYAKTEVIPYVMNRQIVDRVYSLLGSEANDLLSVSLANDGTILMLTSHECDASLAADWGNVAIFEYDDTGKMTAIQTPKERLVISEYDANGRPTKVGMTTVFTYAGNDMTVSVDGKNFYTIDPYGRCVKYEEMHEGYSHLYTLTLNGKEGTWRYNNGNNYDDVYSVVYETPTRMLKMIETAVNGRVNFFYEFQYDAVGLAVSALRINDPDDAERRAGNRCLYEYDADAHLTKKITHIVKGTEESKGSEFHYRYTENGQLCEEKQYDADGALLLTLTYAYNESGKLTRSENIYENGDRNIYEYTFNENGAMVKEISVRYESGTLIDRVEQYLEYHANGVCAKKTYIYINDTEKPYHQTVNEYREDGACWRGTSMTFDSAGQKDKEYITEYHANQNPAKETTILYSGGVEVTRIEKRYDEDGRLLQP